MSPSAMHVISLVIVLVAIFSLMPTTRAYNRIVPKGQSVGQGYCYDSELNIAVPMNAIRQRPGRCESMRCGIDYSLYISGCGVIGAGSGYFVTPTDYSKPYPDCCPKLVRL